MTNLLIRLFIRDYKNTESPTVRHAYGKVAGLVGIVSNLLLAAAKLIVGIFSNSIAITADAINNLTDSASSVVTLVGFKLASKPADKEHPYGHARMEYIAGLIVSIVILVLGFELGRSSLEKILNPGESDFNIVVLCILGGSILMKLWQGLFYYTMGKRIRSTTLKATAADSRNDVIATSVVLVGCIITRFVGFNLDGYLGMGVAIFILISGFQLIMETSSPLLGAAPSEEVVEKLNEMFSSCPDILGFHDLQVHDYGEQMYFAILHVEVDDRLTLQESHEIVDRLERKAKAELGIELAVHLDPVTVGDDATDHLKKQVLEFLSGISKELCIHDFRMQKGNPTEVTFDIEAPFRFYLTDEKLMEIVEHGVAAMGDNLHVRVTVDHT